MKHPSKRTNAFCRTKITLIKRKLTVLATAVLFCVVSAAHAINPENVLVLYYDDQTPALTQGEAIRDHYLGIHGTGVKTLGLTFAQPPGEEITAQQYLDQIRTPLLNSGMLTDDIQVIVTTKGLPLRIDNGAPGGVAIRYSSLESELTRVDLIDSIPEMQDGNWINAEFGIPNVGPANPYYLGPDVFTLQKSALTSFDRSLYEGMRLASRLDGYTVQNVTDALDRANNEIVAANFQYSLIVDDSPSAFATNLTRMEALYEEVAPLHYLDVTPNPDDFVSPWAVYENTSAGLVTTSDYPVIGYVSHGVHGGLSGGQVGSLDSTGYINTQLEFELADGAVFHTHESFNAFSFDLNTTSPLVSHGQVAQWLAIGGTAGLGHVAEPIAGIFNVSNEDVFFDMMLSGYTFAEAAWAATRQLSYVNTVVGDPLMRYTPWIPGDFNVDGVLSLADIDAFASAYGMSHASFENGDLNGDTLVDLVDLDLLSVVFFPPNSSSSSTSVPEPSSGLLGVLLISTLALYAKR